MQQGHLLDLTIEAPAYDKLHAQSAVPLLFVCDHASNRIPLSLEQLGLSDDVLQRHIAIDIGAADATRSMSNRFGATAVLCNYSRLVVDCNRYTKQLMVIPEISDHTPIPGNQQLSEEARQLRFDGVYWPYHRAIDQELKRLRRLEKTPAVIAMHSFTPVLDDFSRPWEIGILWDTDSRLAVPLIAALRDLGLCVGDNEPYSGHADDDFTIDYHGERVGLPCVSIEIRQDVLSARGDYYHDCLEKALRQVIADEEIFSIKRSA